MSQNGASGEAIWKFDDRIIVNVADENNKAIEKARMIVMQGEKIVESYLIENGYTNIRHFPNGVYDVQLKAKGFQTKQFKIELLRIDGQTFKFQLKEARTGLLTGTVELNKKIITDAPITIRDSDNNEYHVKTDEKGIYRVRLPFGRYFIYSTVSDKCWMCAEFYKNDFLVNTEGEIKLDMELQFLGEG